MKKLHGKFVLIAILLFTGITNLISVIASQGYSDKVMTYKKLLVFMPVFIIQAFFSIAYADSIPADYSVQLWGYCRDNSNGNYHDWFTGQPAYGQKSGAREAIVAAQIPTNCTHLPTPVKSFKVPYSNSLYNKTCTFDNRYEALDGPWTEIVYAMYRCVRDIDSSVAKPESKIVGNWGWRAIKGKYACYDPNYPVLNGSMCESIPEPEPPCPKPEAPPEDCPGPDGTNQQSEQLLSSSGGGYGQIYSNQEELVCTEPAQQSQAMSKSLSQPMESLAVSSTGKWKNNYDRNFQLLDTATPITAAIQMPSGMSYVFEDDGAGGWTGTDTQRASFESLTDEQSVVTGYRLTLKDDSVEEYNTSGYLTSVTKRNGTGVTLSYNGSSQLETITDSFNKTITLAYDGSGRVNQVTSPEGGNYHFEYDGSGNKTKTIYPDNTPASLSDNPFKQFHYEDTNFPDYLTGITNEKGIRTDTWSYDTSGRLISETHPDSADNKTFVFNGDGTTTETNALGKDTIYTFEVFDSVRKVTQVDGVATASCAAASNTKSYDTNGFLVSKTDWEGNTTTYVRNSKGQETSRTEAVGTAEERKITTEWHLTFNLPIKVTNPIQTTHYSYDDNTGSLLEKSINANDDDDGDGVLDIDDAFPLKDAAAVDTDGDGKPDDWLAGCDEACQTNSGLELDTDDDADGIPDVSDSMPLDTDNNGTDNASDDDDDGDGVLDTIDA
ncbi:MAG: RHS repeat protein, partial [Planctomycetes bacterium]|nr:RHS repeat protein [Planctomycetota bacterium]